MFLKSVDAMRGIDHWWLPENVLTVHCVRCFPVRIAFPLSSALLGCAVILSNATRSAGTACFKLALSFVMYSLKYSSAASPDASLVIGDEFCACSWIFVGMRYFSQ